MADILGLLDSIASLIVILAGIVWGYVRLTQTREFSPRVQMSVSVNFIMKHKNDWIVELIASFSNTGMVRYNISHIDFNLRGLKLEDELTIGGSEINNQTYIPHLLKEGSWKPRTWKYTYMEPGMSGSYSFIGSVPANYVLLLLHGKCEFSKHTFLSLFQRKHYTFADCVVKIPQETDDMG